MMKPAVALLLVGGLLVGGCFRALPESPLATDMVQPGKTVRWPDGRSIWVRQRQGNTLGGIRLRQNAQRTIEAERGIISKEQDGRTLRLTLFDATLRQDGKPFGTLQQFSVILRD